MFFYLNQSVSNSLRQYFFSIFAHQGLSFSRGIRYCKILKIRQRGKIQSLGGRMKKTILLCVNLVFVLLVTTSIAHAYVITFGPGDIGSFVGPTIEGDYAYDEFSGGLFRDTQGNGDSFNMEGESISGGGILEVYRDDIVDGLFTFDGADVMYQFNSVYGITFEGYLGGLLQGSDIFATNNTSTYTTYASSGLSGVYIDQLRVTLDAASSWATVVDNIVVTSVSVPEPTTMILFATGLAGLVGISRRKKK